MKYIVMKKGYPYTIAFIAILCGVIIYTFWRPDTIRYFVWLEAVGLRDPVENLRTYIHPLHTPIPEWIIYSLPNGLWAFSYALIITHLWRDNNSKIKYFWFGSIPLLAIGYELMQYAGVLQGVFCYQDLFLSITGIGMGAIMGLTFYRRNEK